MSYGQRQAQSGPSSQPQWNLKPFAAAAFQHNSQQPAGRPSSQPAASMMLKTGRPSSASSYQQQPYIEFAAKPSLWQSSQQQSMVKESAFGALRTKSSSQAAAQPTSAPHHLDSFQPADPGRGGGQASLERFSQDVDSSQRLQQLERTIFERFGTRLDAIAGNVQMMLEACRKSSSSAEAACKSATTAAAEAGAAARAATAAAAAAEATSRAVQLRWIQEKGCQTSFPTATDKENKLASTIADKALNTGRAPELKEVGQRGQAPDVPWITKKPSQSTQRSHLADCRQNLVSNINGFGQPQAAGKLVLAANKALLASIGDGAARNPQEIPSRRQSRAPIESHSIAQLLSFDDMQGAGARGRPQASAADEKHHQAAATAKRQRSHSSAYPDLQSSAETLITACNDEEIGMAIAAKMAHHRSKRMKKLLSARADG